jgi:hypothetical protein
MAQSRSLIGGLLVYLHLGASTAACDKACASLPLRADSGTLIEREVRF